MIHKHSDSNFILKHWLGDGSYSRAVYCIAQEKAGSAASRNLSGVVEIRDRTELACVNDWQHLSASVKMPARYSGGSLMTRSVMSSMMACSPSQIANAVKTFELQQ